MADKLFSQIVRSEGRCAADDGAMWITIIAGGLHVVAGSFQCRGNLQCAHVLSRRYLAVRFERMNAMCLCAAHHVWYTHHPIEWEDFCRKQLGSAIYDELRRKALAGGRPDYSVLIPALRAELAKVAAA